MNDLNMLLSCFREKMPDRRRLLYSHSSEVLAAGSHVSTLWISLLTLLQSHPSMLDKVVIPGTILSRARFLYFHET